MTKKDNAQGGGGYPHSQKSKIDLYYPTTFPVLCSKLSTWVLYSFASDFFFLLALVGLPAYFL